MDVSQKRIEANRRNALLSTGPKTVEGKARSSRNAVTHGVFSSQVVLECENEATFEQFRAGMMRDLAPLGELETMLADKVVAIAWKTRRLLASERAALRQGVETLQIKFNTKWADERRYRDKRQRAKLPAAPATARVEQVFDSVPERIHKYEQMLERSMYKAMDQLKQWQKIRGERPEVEEVTECQNEPTLESEASLEHGRDARATNARATNASATSALASGIDQNDANESEPTVHGLEARATSGCVERDNQNEAIGVTV